MDNEATGRAYAGNVTVPFLAERGAPIGRSLATLRGERWGLALAQEADALVRYRSLAGDPEFRALATWRYDWARSGRRRVPIVCGQRAQKSGSANAGRS